jgi:hypothetical protein
MRTESATVKSFLDGRRSEILFRQKKAPTCSLRDCLWHTAADPQQLVQIDSDCGGGRRIKRIRHVDPRAHLVGFRDAGQKRERCRRSPGTLPARQFADRTNRKAAVKKFVQRFYACFDDRANHLRLRSQRRWDLPGESGFNLHSNCGS